VRNNRPGGGAPRVCVVGSSNMDLVVRTSRLPRAGETLTATSLTTVCGGKGGNQAVMAARLGAAVRLVGKVGRDVFGEQLRQNYREQGVDTTHLLEDAERSTGVATILVDDAAQNCILVVPGANGALTPDDVRAATPAVTTADVLLCQLEVPAETTAEALRLARAAGVRTVLNPAPAVPLSDELLKRADLCVPNETELEALTGLPTRTEADLDAALDALLRRGPRGALVTLGAGGSLYKGEGRSERVAAVPVDAVDSTAAGDAYIGSLAVSLAAGTPLREAMHRASAVAALTVTRPGAQGSFPSRQEVEVFLARR
jgi:ribokinase